MHMNENEFRDYLNSIQDDFGFYGAKPYIYTNGKNHYEEGFRWFIMHWKSEEKAKKFCPDGFQCETYKTIYQWQ